MSQLLRASVDLTKIKKEHIFQSEKGGKFINLDIWINHEPDKYGNHAGVKQTYKVGEEFKGHYIGNGKKVLGWDDQPAEPQKEQPPLEPEANEDDLPF